MADHQNQVLDYAPTPERPVRGWWILFILSLIIFAIESANPPTPPGWPVFMDYVAMIVFWLGAILLSVHTTLPMRILFWYGLFGSCLFLAGASSNSRLGLRLADETRAREFMVNWILFIGGSTVFCWATGFLRLLINRRTRRPVDS